MARHGNASPRTEASRTEASRTEASRTEASRTESSRIETADVIDAALKRRARLLLTNSSIPHQTRALIRYALDIRDAYLPQLVRRVEAGEINIDHLRRE